MKISRTGKLVISSGFMLAVVMLTAPFVSATLAQGGATRLSDSIDTALRKARLHAVTSNSPVDFKLYNHCSYAVTQGNETLVTGGTPFRNADCHIEGQKMPVTLRFNGNGSVRLNDALMTQSTHIQIHLGDHHLTETVNPVGLAVQGMK